MKNKFNLNMDAIEFLLILLPAARYFR